MLLRMLRKRNSPPLLMGLQAGKITLEINLVLPQKIGTGYTILLGIYPEHTPTCNEDTCSNLFTTMLFIIARSRKQKKTKPNQLSFNTGMDIENVVNLNNRVLLSY